MKNTMRLVPVLCAIGMCNAAALSVASEEDTHDHWEWAGLYHITDSRLGHTLIVQRGEGVDIDFHMKILAVPSPSGDDDGLEEAEKAAEEITEQQEPTEVSGSTVDIAMETLYELSQSNTTWLTSVHFRFPADGFYAVFLEHDIDELCESDCFRDSTGAHLEPLVVESAHSEHFDDDHDSNSADWGSTMAGTFVVWATVFSGIILLAGGSNSYYALSDSIVLLISMFAAGALLSTAFCLILVEASHFISSSDLSEGAVSGLWGAMILVGFLTATVIDLFREVILRYVTTAGNIAPTQIGSNTNRDEKDLVTPCDSDNGVELGDTKGLPSPVVVATPSHKASGVLVSILTGDFLHNFCDGVFIGTAFQSCSSSLGWTIVATTACHELAQEIADFIILTKTAGLTVPSALAVNAASGMSVVLGGIVVSATSLSDLSIGVLLAFGSGNYIYLAAAELFPSVHSDIGKTSISHKILGLLLFCAGAAAVGLVLLNHEHCDSSLDSDSSHDSHNH